MNSGSKVLYQVDQLPVFQNKMYVSSGAAIACPKGNIVLVQDRKSGLISNVAFDAKIMHYDSSYQNEQGCSSTFVKHLHEVGAIIQRHCQGAELVEIGCGKGFFLEYLASLGARITGFDPAYEGDNPAIIKEYYGHEVSIRADGVILRHVLEHVSNPIEFLFDLRNAKEDTKIYIEVPCFDWISQKRAWFDIFYEHVNYFREDDFRRIFGRIYESGHFFGGQYLYVLADLASMREPVFNGEPVALPDDFLRSVRFASSRVKSIPEKPSVVWGGASKGVIFSLLMKRAGAEIDHVIDINPSKQGMFLPATGLKVSSPEDALSALPDGTNVFIMNSNYADEIISLAGDRFQYWRIDNDF